MGVLSRRAAEQGFRLRVRREQQNLTRLHEFDGEHQTRIVGGVVQLQRESASGCEPVGVDPAPLLIRLSRFGARAPVRDNAILSAQPVRGEQGGRPLVLG